MNSEEIIKDIFVNYVGYGETSSKTLLLNERIDENTKKLNKIINKKNRKKLKTLCDDYEEVNLIETENCFVRGFSFAVQLMAEAFSQK